MNWQVDTVFQIHPIGLEIYAQIGLNLCGFMYLNDVSNLWEKKNEQEE